VIFVVSKSNLSVINLQIAKISNVKLQNFATKGQKSEMLHFWIGLIPIVLRLWKLQQYGLVKLL